MIKQRERVGYQLARAQHALRLQLDKVLRVAGLTTPQYGALCALEETPGLSGNRLARLLFVSPQTMNLILVNLEHAGLIVRQPHPEHGRVLQAYLTSKGSQLVRECHPQVLALHERMVADLSESERQQLVKTLRTCADALEGGRSITSNSQSPTASAPVS